MKKRLRKKLKEEKNNMGDNLINDVKKLMKFLRGSKKKSKRYKKSKSWFTDAIHK